MRFYTKQRRSPVINVVSMIDILCILLIFFIVTSTFKKVEPQVNIKLPESTTGKKEDQAQKPIIIYATKTQRVYVGDQEIPLSTLTSILKAELAREPSAFFALKADTEIPLGFFVKVTDAAKQAGVTNLTMYTQEAKPAHP